MTPNQKLDAEACFTNPHRSIGDAWFYASMTGQSDIDALLMLEMEKLTEIAENLSADGLFPALEVIGAATFEAQQFAENNVNKDQRFRKFLEITKVRFMVEVMNSSAQNSIVESVRDYGYVGRVETTSFQSRPALS